MENLPVVALAEKCRPSASDPTIWVGTLTPSEYLYALRRSHGRDSATRAQRIELETMVERGSTEARQVVFKPTFLLLEELKLLQRQ